MSALDKQVMKGNAPKEDMVMMMMPFEDLESRLSCAPLCINVLGQLCLISTQRDFSIRVQGVDSKFEYLTHPDSFRACLSQVSHEGYRAFLEADTAMESIRLQTHRVPELLKASLQILYGGATPEEIGAFLPKKLEAIDLVAKNCEREAKSVVEYFERVINTLSELNKQTLLMQGKTQEAKEQHELKIKQEEEEKKMLDRMNAEKKEEIEDLKKQVEDARSDYKDALNSMPGAGEMILGTVVDGLSTAINSAATAFQMAKTPITAARGWFERDGAREEMTMDDDGVPRASSKGHRKLDANDKKLIESTMQMKNIVKSMLSFFDQKGQLDSRAAELGGEGTMKAKDASVLLEIIQGKVNKLQGKSAKDEEVRNLVAQALNLATNIQRPQGATSVKELHESAENLFSTLDSMCAESAKRMGVSQFQRSGPQSPSQPEPEKGSGLVKSMVESAHRKVETTRAELTSLRDSSRKSQKEAMELQRDLQESMARLDSFKDVVATSKEMLEIIQEGLKAFAQLKSQWAKLHQFFISMSTLIKASLSPQINQFVGEAKEMQKLEAPTQMAKEIVYQTAYQAVKVSAVVHHLSDSYCHISKGYLMPLTLELDHMLCLDKDRDRNEIVQRRGSLKDGATKAQRAIMDIIQRKHQEFVEMSDKRIKAIDSELKSLALPEIPEEKKQKIKAEAKMVVEKVNKEMGELDDFC